MEVALLTGVRDVREDPRVQRGDSESAHAGRPKAPSVSAAGGCSPLDGVQTPEGLSVC